MASRRDRREPTGPFDGIIPDLYDALLQPQVWPDVLSRMADAAKVGGVPFLCSDARGVPLMSQMSADIPAEANELYGRYYGAIDPRRKRIQEFPVGKLMLCQREFDDDFVRRDEFYNDYCIPLGFRYIAGTRAFRENGHEAIIGFLKNVGTDPFDAREVRMLQTLLPHFRRVAQLQDRLASLQSRVAPLVGTLDRLTSGVIIVDQDLRVRFLNRAAEELAQAEDGLLVRNNRLGIAHAPTSQALHRLVAEAGQCAAGGDAHQGGGSLAVPRLGGRRPLLLLIAPLPARSAEPLWRAEPAVAIFVTDPDSQACTPAERLAALFGLTPAEARLAASLAAGASLDETADAFGLSKLTLRTQLRILLDKTGTNRQAALVRMLSMIAAH